jgi:hypothetical protein
MSVVESLANVFAPWQSMYADNSGISVTITAIHIVALLIGGGLALATDRSTLRVLRRTAPERALHAAEIRDVHRPVLLSLLALAASGLLMATADIEEFLANPVFWVKMGSIALLLANGYMLQKRENAVLENRTDSYATADSLWKKIGFHSRVSMGLWIFITIAGVVLVG